VLRSKAVKPAPVVTGNGPPGNESGKTVPHAHIEKLSQHQLSPAVGIHPAADAFPMMSPSELQELADDIKTNGLSFSIVRDKNGLILDGRNRLAACEIAGVVPRFGTYQGNNPVGLVITANLRRRHMSESQRALVASKLATLSHGGDRRSDQGANLHLEIPKASIAAAMLNVSERSLASAAVVRKHGTPELIRKVEQGEISVSAAAKIAQPPKPKSKPTPAAKPTPSKPVLGKAIDLGSLPAAWREVELAAAAGNQTHLKASLKNLLKKVTHSIKSGVFK
jgi:hypothetical protein